MTEYEKEPCFEDENFDSERGGIDYILFTLESFLKSQPSDTSISYKLLLFKESPKDGAAGKDKE